MRVAIATSNSARCDDWCRPTTLPTRFQAARAYTDCPAAGPAQYGKHWPAGQLGVLLSEAHSELIGSIAPADGASMLPRLGSPSSTNICADLYRLHAAELQARYHEIS